MTPQQAAQELKRRARELKRQGEKTQKIMAARAVDRAKGWSRGPVSSSDQARMGHPYSRRNPNPPLDPALINYQSGRLYRSWRRRYETHGDTLQATVFNIAPEAVFLDPYQQTGANKSIGRPLAKAVIQSLRSGYKPLLRERVKEALKQ